MYRRMTAFFSSALMMLLSVAVIVAQADCTALMEDAFSALDANCNSAGRNEACYGFNRVEASFLSQIDASTFSQPRDIAAVADIATIRTAPLSSANGTWGIALMNIQANLPDTLPGQSVTFILMGDVEIENAVAPEDAFDPDDGIEVVITTPGGANVRSGPGLTFNVIGGAVVNSNLVADGLSEDNEWIRVIYSDRPAWISRVTVAENPAIDALPVLTADLNTPMQAFYLRTGIGQPECAEAPDDLLLVQGPENIEIEITVNGADISLGSSGALRIIEIDGIQYLEIIVFDGQFTTGGQTIHAGQRSIMCLSDANNPGLDGEANNRIVECPASVPETIPPGEFGETWCVMEDVPDNILNYGLEVLCPGETPPPPPSDNNTSGGSPSEIEGVDCSSFTITTQQVVATDFVLTWTEASGATEYHVAVFDSGGNEISLLTGITGTSVGVNGGTHFSGSGSVHVRAFFNGAYACVTSLSYSSRSPDPNEPAGGYGNDSVFSASLIECRRYGGGDAYSVVVSWSNATTSISLVSGADTATVSGASGSYELFSFSTSGVQVTSGDYSSYFPCGPFVDY